MSLQACFIVCVLSFEVRKDSLRVTRGLKDSPFHEEANYQFTYQVGHSRETDAFLNNPMDAICAKADLHHTYSQDMHILIYGLE